MPLFATAFQDRLSIYRDASGASLHRRGYRQAMHRSALNEAAAAGCLYLAGWKDILQRGDGAPVMADPMCGSGTFLIEAALMATNTAPGLFRRHWPFLTWPDADQDAWKHAVRDAKNASKKRADVRLYGNDAHSGALSLALKDAEAAGVGGLIRLHHGECSEWTLPANPPLTLVVSNPPWGQRLMADDEVNEDGESALAAAWKSLGTFLKREAPGANAFVLSGSAGATQALKMRASRRIPVTIGGVDCRLLEYQIFRGKAPVPADRR